MTTICAKCGGEIAETNDSEEHVINQAIGGRRTVRGLLHEDCNNEAGYTWDAELARQLQPLSLHFGVKRQSGRAPRMRVTTTAGEEMLLGPKGELAMIRPDVKRSPTPQGENFQVTTGSVEQARKWLEAKKRKNLRIDVEGTLAAAQVQRSYLQGAVRIDLGFGGELAGRSLVKSALALAYDAGISIDQCGDALNYLRKAVGTPCFGYYYIGDLIAERPAETPLHCIAIEANPETGLILGYAEYFGIHRAVVCLGRGFVGEPAKAVYGIDPRTGDELDLAVRLGFTAAQIEAIYDYQMDDAAGRQHAFGLVFGPALRAQHEAERTRVIKDAFDYAWENCGATPNAMLTAQDQQTICRLFAERTVSWLQHATGANEQVARQQAEAFAAFVLRTAPYCSSRAVL
jgi:hypothetical protein